MPAAAAAAEADPALSPNGKSSRDFRFRPTAADTGDGGPLLHVEVLEDLRLGDGGPSRAARFEVPGARATTREVEVVAASSTTTAGTTTPSATASPSRPALCSPCWCSNSGLLVVCTYGWHKNDKLSSHCIFVFNTFNIEKLKKKWRKAICMYQYFFPSQILKFAIKLVIRKG